MKVLKTGKIQLNKQQTIDMVKCLEFVCKDVIEEVEKVKREGRKFDRDKVKWK